jgi:hypothetical protein
MGSTIESETVTERRSCTHVTISILLLNEKREKKRMKIFLNFLSIQVA